MKKLASVFAMAALILASATTAAFAQSSGNFSATGTGASCALGAGGTFTGGTGIHTFVADISTSNGSGVTLDIRPSFVTGLFTDTKISTSIPSASAEVGIKVCVTVDGSGAGILPTNCAIYDERFQQISSQLFSQIAACNTVVCTTNTDCAGTAGAVCFNPTGLSGAGTCVSPTTTACASTADCPTGDACVGGFCAATVGLANPSCNFDLILSTLSAHSFEFVVPVGHGKPHVVEATWSVIGSGAVSPSSVASCVGPGIVTVTQVKVFNNSGALTF